MAVWKKKKEEARRRTGLVFAMIVIVALFVIFYFKFVKDTTPPSFKINLPEEAVGIGWLEFTVEASEPLNAIRVQIDYNEANLVSRFINNTYVFSYFVSPHEDVGNKTIKIVAMDKAGNTAIDEKNILEIDFRAAGTRIDDIIYYSYEFRPIAKARDILSKQNLSFFFEVDEGVSDRNENIINSYIPLLTKLGSIGKSLSSYGIEVRNRKWINCMDSNSTQMQIDECRRILDETNSIILKIPDYSTNQILITNNTIEIQAKYQDLEKTISSLIQLIEKPEIVVE